MRVLTNHDAHSNQGIGYLTGVSSRFLPLALSMALRRGSPDCFVGGEDRIDQRRDLIHGAVDVEREAEEIDLRERRVAGHEMIPCGLLRKRDGQSLVVSIAEVAHPAEQVAEMNQAGEGTGRLHEIQSVVATDGFREFV